MKTVKITASEFYTKRSGLEFSDFIECREKRYEADEPEENHLEYILAAEPDTMYWITNDGSDVYHELSEAALFFNILKIVKSSPDAERLKKIILGDEITSTKDIHDLTDEERLAIKDGHNSSISIQLGNAWITGGTLKERSELTGEKLIEAHITPDNIRDEEDVEMYILDDCVLIVGYTICAILDSKPWEGVNFPCRAIHDLRG